MKKVINKEQKKDKNLKIKIRRFKRKFQKESMKLLKLFTIQKTVKAKP